MMICRNLLALALAFCSVAPSECLAKNKGALTAVSYIPSSVRTHSLAACSHARLLNATVHSWLGFANEVLLFTDDPAWCLPFASHRTVRCSVPTCVLPSALCLLRAAQDVARHRLLLFVDVNIQLGAALPTLAAVQSGELESSDFLLAGGARLADDPCGKAPGPTRQLDATSGPPKYVLLNRTSSVIDDLPDFHALDYRWIQWLIATAKTSGLSVIDATQAIAARDLRYHVLKTEPRALDVDAAFMRLGSLRDANFAAEAVDPFTVRIATNQPGQAGTTAQVLSQCAHHRSGMVAVVVVQEEYLPLLDNWLCWAERREFSSFVFIPMDAASAAAVSEKKLPALALQSNATALNESSVPVALGAALGSILDAGHGFMTADLDMLWLGDPLALFSSMPCDAMTMNGTYFHPFVGFTAVQPTVSGTKLWRQVQDCLASRSLGPDALKLCTRMLVTHAPSVGGRHCFAPPTLMTRGASLFKPPHAQREGLVPELVHFDHTPLVDDKVAAMRNWSFWLADYPSMCAPTEFPTARPWGLQYLLTVRVLTMDRPWPLRRLLRSITNADYEDDRVDLEIWVDCPKKSTPEYEEVVGVAETFIWPHGKLTVVVHNETQGIFNQWIAEYHPRDDAHVLLVLEDDLELSPMYYTWSKAAFEHYYFDPSNYDARAYGLSLERQHVVLGLGRNFRYPQKVPDAVGRAGPLYATQVASSWGQFFFPKPFAEFVRWARHARANLTGFDPCVPGLLSNYFYLQRKSSVWTVWMQRFVFDYGLHNFYFNYAWFDRELVPAVLATNYREVGMHFNESTMPAEAEALLGEAPDIEFAPAAELPVYDFYMEPAPDKRSLADRWRLVSALQPRDACFVKWV